MCGIAGFVGPGTPADLLAMCGRIVHRGPDDGAVWTGEVRGRPVSLGFRRLTILDAEGGRQPMAAQDGRLRLVYNGEIYNHRELRKELEELGQRFRSDHSDTEVLLRGYAQWGEAVVPRLNGMFAFALLDAVAGTLFLARDRFGKKPLYLGRFDDGFAFGSELAALTAHPCLTAQICPEALVRYFAFGYVPAPATLCRGVTKLLPGESLTYDVAGGRLQRRRYWHYGIEPESPPPGTPRDWAVELRDLLRNAVGRRLESDVPLGFFLSGGIDSASVLALAAPQMAPRGPRSFTVGFRESSYDESTPARLAAAHVGAEHHERTLDIEAARRLTEDLLPRIDEPLADPSLLPTYLVSRFAREQITVALTGDGGDELFAGYDPFAATRLALLYHRVVPRRLHPVIRAAAGLLPRRDSNLSLDFLLRRTLRGLDHPPPLWDAVWLAPADLEEIGEITGTPTDPEFVYADVMAAWKQCRSAHPGDRQLEYYAHFYLPGDILAKLDRASMLCSLELRTPFLDKDLAEFCMRLPYRVKHRGGTRKWLLREAMAPLLPREILRRPKKGFGIPVAAWLRELPMPAVDRAEDLGLDGAVLARKWRAHAAGQADHRGLLWAWLCLDAAWRGLSAPRAREAPIADHDMGGRRTGA